MDIPNVARRCQKFAIFPPKIVLHLEDYSHYRAEHDIDDGVYLLPESAREEDAEREYQLGQVEHPEEARKRGRGGERLEVFFGVVYIIL